MLAVTSITFFRLADVRCDLYEINENKTTEHMLHMDGKMFRDRNEAMLDWRRPGPGAQPVTNTTVNSKLIVVSDGAS